MAPEKFFGLARCELSIRPKRFIDFPASPNGAGNLNKSESRLSLTKIIYDGKISGSDLFGGERDDNIQKFSGFQYPKPARRECSLYLIIVDSKEQRRWTKAIHQLLQKRLAAEVLDEIVAEHAELAWVVFQRWVDEEE